MAKTKDPKDSRIAELEDKLKIAERRITELKNELAESEQLSEERREWVEEGLHETLEQWKCAFDMVLGDDSKWTFKPWVEQRDEITNKYTALLRDWNRFVGEYNAVVAPRGATRGVGRPLAASEAQIADVRKLRKFKASLREIARETGLTLRTVSTIIGKDEGSDRTAKKRGELKRKELHRARMASWRTQSRARKALPGRINELTNRGAELAKRNQGNRR